MSGTVKLNRGLDIKLKGIAKSEFLNDIKSKTFALNPDDFIGITPKLFVKVDDIVKAGTPIFYDKENAEIKIVSPVSGKIKEINRGERRKILNVVIETQYEQEYLQYDIKEVSNFSREQIINLMLEGGLWPFVIQRPFGTIANYKDTPKAIFISGFDSSPLAPDLEFILRGEEANLQAGIDILKKLTTGKIHISIKGNSKNPSIFENLKNVESCSYQITKFVGPHPAGNVGVQIHHIEPINKGEVVWTVRPEDVVVIGKFFTKGIYDVSRIVTIAGSEIKNTGYIKTISGAQISFIEKSNVTGIEKRYISGNVLTGSTISENGYLGFYDRMITVIPEGKHFEFLGWAMLGLDKFSMSKSFVSWLSPKKEYSLNTNFNGSERAFVMTGQYEKVVPMDILPQHLIKAALIEDVELMENLGIYEVIEEDLALCEFVCTSKIEVQEIIRKALNLVKKEMS